MKAMAAARKGMALSREAMAIAHLCEGMRPAPGKEPAPRRRRGAVPPRGFRLQGIEVLLALAAPGRRCDLRRRRPLRGPAALLLPEGISRLPTPSLRPEAPVLAPLAGDCRAAQGAAGRREAVLEDEAEGSRGRDPSSIWTRLGRRPGSAPACLGLGTNVSGSDSGSCLGFAGASGGDAGERAGFAVAVASARGEGRRRRRDGEPDLGEVEAEGVASGRGEELPRRPHPHDVRVPRRRRHGRVHQEAYAPLYGPQAPDRLLPKRQRRPCRAPLVHLPEIPSYRIGHGFTLQQLLMASLVMSASRLAFFMRRRHGRWRRARPCPCRCGSQEPCR